jgi:undecaprenyl-diphosphatase
MIDINVYLQSTLLGIVEGLTEFLPVSSTAHLRIAEGLLGIPMDDAFWKMYTIVIQLGAILCLPVYFFPRIVKLLRTFPNGERGDRNIFTHPLSLTMIAFVVTAGPAFLLTKVIGENLESYKVMGLALLIGGIVMWIVDGIFGKPKPMASGFDALTTALTLQGNLKSASGGAGTITSIPVRMYRTESMEEMNIWQAIWIGACQILSAVFPGTSRSMSTITAGQLVGMSRAAALEFSFFLSMPTMMLATLWTLKKAVFPKAGDAADAISPSVITQVQWIILGIGFVVSFIVALGVVAWFMAWVRRHGFSVFAIYRIILGAVLLTWLYRNGAF